MYPHLARIGAVTIPTFGVVAALGLVLSILLAARCARMLRIGEDAVWNLCLFTAAGTLLLSRLVIVAQVPRSFMQYPLYILTLPTVTRFGLLLALLSGLAYALFMRLPLLRTADAIAPAALLLQGFLHAGSVFAGDDLGAATNSWLGHVVPGDPGYHPVAFYSAVLSFFACALTYLYLRREPRPGEVAGLALVLAALLRFYVDELRPSYVLPDAMAGFLRVDQLVLTVVAAVGLCFFFDRSSFRKERNAQ